MEIPTKIQYDFLLVLLGFALVISPFVIPSLEFINRDILLLSLIDIIGVFMLIYGTGLIRYDYYLNQELKELDYAKKKLQYIEFFEEKGIITSKSKNKHKKDIEEIIN